MTTISLGGSILSCIIAFVLLESLLFGFWSPNVRAAHADIPMALRAIPTTREARLWVNRVMEEHPFVGTGIRLSETK
jgi:hypothetical protein